MAYIIPYPSHLPTVNNREEVQHSFRPPPHLLEYEYHQLLLPPPTTPQYHLRLSRTFNDTAMQASSSFPTQDYAPLPIYPAFYPPGAQSSLPTRIVVGSSSSSSTSTTAANANTPSSSNYVAGPSSSTGSSSTPSRLRPRSQSRPTPVTIPNPASLVPRGPSSHDSYFSSSRPLPALVRQGSQDSNPTLRDLQDLDIYTPTGSTTIPSSSLRVRWTEDLIAPTPPPRFPRRKGFYNARGDQLWTNDGRYKPALEPLFPVDLADYPQPGEGWANELGIVIDMKHRLCPKASVKPVLKKTSGK